MDPIVAKYCPDPLDPPDGGTTTVLNSGLHFGMVCPGNSGAAESFPVVGCGEYDMKIQKTGSSATANVYDIIVNNIPGNSPSLVMLFVFSQPLTLAELQISSSQVPLLIITITYSLD